MPWPCGCRKVPSGVPTVRDSDEGGVSRCPPCFLWGPTRCNTPQCTLRLSCCASHAGTRPRINSDWGLGDWLRTKSWTIDEGHALLQNPVILNAVIDHLSPLFPGYQLPDEAGGLFVGALTCFDCRYNIITYYDIITELITAACPIRLMFRSLRNGFACLLSDWETAAIQTADDYEV